MLKSLSPWKQLNKLWSKLPVRHKGAVVILIPTVCVIMTVVAWASSKQLVGIFRQKIEISTKLVTEIDNLFIELLNTETGVRGYVITNNSKFLEPYHQGISKFPQALVKIGQLLPTDSPKQGKLRDTESVVMYYMNTLQQVIAISEQPQDLRISQLLDQEKEAMDNIRLLLGSLKNEEEKLLVDYQKQRANILSITTLVLWVCVVVSFIAFSVALYLFNNLDQELSNKEMLLREIKSLIKAIVSKVVDGVITLDKNGKIEMFNSTATKMFGYEIEEIIGQDLDILLAEPLNFKFASEQKLGYSAQTKGLRQNGATFPIEISISHIQFDNGLIVIIRDITKFQEIEASLKTRADQLVHLTKALSEANLALEKRNKELDQFAYVTSHDLKAPLRAIANLSEWIEEDLADKLPDENKLQMRLLRGRVHRMEALINGLLDYSRIGRTETQAEIVNVEVLLCEIIDSLDPPFSFTTEISSKMPTLITKKLLLRQIFSNLISNAIKHHNRTDGHIKISVEDQEEFYQFSITDDGPGIAPEYHDKIFAIFQTLTPRDTKENTGIGLSIVKKIVESEGGRIWLDSQEGFGTTFYFTWHKATPLY